MPEPIPTAPADGGQAQSQKDGNAEGLRAEIAFWSELLETSGEETSPETRERMGFALALAQKRLETLFEEFNPAGKPQECRHNVFYLDSERR